MSEDRSLFQAPKPPEPPKGMYEIPKTPADERLKPIFPWESRALKPTRVFADDVPEPSTAPSSETAPSTITDPTDTEETETEKITPTTPSVGFTSAEAFANYARSNAWDDMPEIDRYIASLPQNRRAKVQVLFNKVNNTAAPLEPSSSTGESALFSPSTEDAPPASATQRRPSMKVTDFPTEIERPSLPVTPAPVRRPSFWSAERDAAGDLPGAEGVPEQSEWDPVAKLVELQRRQSEVLEKGQVGEGRSIPSRGLVESSKGSLPVVGEEQTTEGNSQAQRTDASTGDPGPSFGTLNFAGTTPVVATATTTAAAAAAAAAAANAANDVAPNES